MNGIKKTGGKYLTPDTAGGNWKVVGATDMNGDGKPDLVFQEATTKKLYVWYMNGIKRTSGKYLTPNTAGGNWKVVAVQDMNGDGKADLVWQDFTAKKMYVWLMNGATRTSGKYLTPSSITGAWRISGGTGAWADIAAGASSGGTDDEGIAESSETESK